MADNNDWNEDRLMAGRCQDEDGANLMALGSNNKKNRNWSIDCGSLAGIAMVADDNPDLTSSTVDRTAADDGN